MENNAEINSDGTEISQTTKRRRRDVFMAKFIVFMEEVEQSAATVLIPSEESKNKMLLDRVQFPTYRSYKKKLIDARYESENLPRFFLEILKIPTGIYQLWCKTRNDDTVVSYAIGLNLYKVVDSIVIEEFYMFGFEDQANQVALGKQALALCCRWVMDNMHSLGLPRFQGFVIPYLAVEDLILSCNYREYIKALGFEENWDKSWVFQIV